MSDSRDPFDSFNEPARPEEAAGYLIEMLASMSHFAHISDLHNSSVMLAAASRVVEQECRLRTDGPPKLRGEPPTLPYPFGVED
ncbi:MAG: hypothetical protein ABL308_11875 [Oceanicaulis sp.]